MDLLGALAEESRNEEPTHPAIAIRAVGGEAEAVLLAWLHPPQGQGTEPFGPLGAEHPQQSVEMSDASASQQIDDIVRRTAGWRGERLSQLRALIRGADPAVIEEVKWKKPSRPEGVPVWSHDGIVCIGEALKNAVRLTMPSWDQTGTPSGREGFFHFTSSITPGSASLMRARSWLSLSPLQPAVLRTMSSICWEADASLISTLCCGCSAPSGPKGSVPCPCGGCSQSSNTASASPPTARIAIGGCAGSSFLLALARAPSRSIHCGQEG